MKIKHLLAVQLLGVLVLALTEQWFYSGLCFGIAISTVILFGRRT